eukprot:1157491-Pelagomonas_calceolata.AAC.10
MHARKARNSDTLRMPGVDLSCHGNAMQHGADDDDGRPGSLAYKNRTGIMDCLACGMRAWCGLMTDRNLMQRNFKLPWLQIQESGRLAGEELE